METTTPIKKNRERSKEYPRYNLQTCIEFTGELIDKLGKGFSSSEKIASAFDAAITTLGGKLSSCKQFGLLELKKKDGYSPTDYYTKAKLGTDTMKREALLYCIQQPTIYGDFIAKRNGEKFPTDLDKIMLFDYQVAAKAKDMAAKIFRESIDFIGLINSENILSVENIIIREQVEEPTKPTTGSPKEKTEKKHNILPATITTSQTENSQHQPKEKNTQFVYKEADYRLAENVYVKVIYPDNVTNGQIDKLCQLLQLQKV